MTLQVVTANRLDDGLAVFYTKEGQWSSSITEASVVGAENDASDLLAQASSVDNKLIVVGPYLIDVEEQNGEPVPVRYREMIRTKGPSVRPDVGYQAEK